MSKFRHTPGPWKWGIMDISTAVLHGLRDGIYDVEMASVMHVSPCPSCISRAKDNGDTNWKWGRCTTPSEYNAKLIAAAPDLLECAVELYAAQRRDFGVDSHITKATAGIIEAASGMSMDEITAADFY